MGPVSYNNANLNNANIAKASTQSADAQPASSNTPLKIEQNTVTLSDEGKALLEALKQIEQSQPKPEKKEGITEQMESFAHGALGMDHPDKIEEEDDSSYSAGQYLSAAATIGGIILALV
ncbi:hypothetical protein [Vibrio maerlii]|uniref:hypothetical protein n=1 Tax=Vibrio maerlii TaxID=2231648 RepID=UPI000E3E375D|nr:hypothetical protein [Vibrio maerlii]